MKTLIAGLVLILCATLQGQSPYTLTLADGTTTVTSPHRAGINLASLNYYDNGQLYKNLVAQDNYGFENTLSQQIWALSKAGSSSTFCNTNQYAVYPVNFWSGASLSVVESESANTGFKTTIASNTTGGSGSPACYTLTTGAPAAFAAGDEVILTLNQFPTKETCWEASSCGIWTNIGNGGKLLTDSTTPYDGKQSLILDTTAAANSIAGVNLYFDSDSQNHFVVLNGSYEIAGWMKTGSVAANHVLTVCAGRNGGEQCKNVTPTSDWTKFSISLSLSETNTTQNTALVSATVQGANGRGQIEVDDLSLTKTSGQDSTNTSVFRDEFVDAMRQYCATDTAGPSCLIRNWTNQNGETMANWTATQSASVQTIAGAGAVTYGEITPRLFDYLNLVKLVGGTAYLVEPVTFQGSDPAALVEYLSSTDTSSGYGKIRADQGQVEPWVGPNGVFSDIYLSFCNECWNDSSFSGQALPWRSGIPDYYHDYWNRAKDVYAAMRADSAFDPGIHLGFNMQLGVNYAPGGIDTGLAGMAAVGGAADYVEQGPYQQGTISSWQTDSALWGSALEQPWEDATNPKSRSGYYQSVKAIQGYKLCGASGKEACAATDYEQANGTLTSCGVGGWPACTGGANQVIDQNHEDRINAGAAEGVIAPLQVALNQQQLGVTAQNYFGATEYSNGTLYGSTAKIAKLWGICVDYGGATSYLNSESYNCRPQFYGMSVLNQAIIGPEYSCSIASAPAYNWPGSTVNGPTVAENGVPYLYPFCFKSPGTNPTQRSIVLFNTNLTNSYSVALAGTNLPTGACAQQQFAPKSPDLLNEAATGTPTNSTTPTLTIASSSVACGSSITLPPDSETAITYSVGGTATATSPTFTPAAGTYTATQSVAIASSTAGSTIHYTTDGSNPTTSSPVYSTPLAVRASQTLSALATASDQTTSPTASASYVIGSASSTATPTVAQPAGVYTAAVNVQVSDATQGSVLYYTLDGSTPTTSSSRYSSYVQMNKTETLTVIAAKTGSPNSTAFTGKYSIEPHAATPTLSLPGGTYTGAQTETLSDTTAGAVIYYTTDQSTPTTSSTRYTGAISIAKSQYLQTMAVASNFTQSFSAAANITISH